MSISIYVSPEANIKRQLKPGHGQLPGAGLRRSVLCPIHHLYPTIQTQYISFMKILWKMRSYVYCLMMPFQRVYNEKNLQLLRIYQKQEGLVVLMMVEEYRRQT